MILIHFVNLLLIFSLILPLTTLHLFISPENGSLQNNSCQIYSCLSECHFACDVSLSELLVLFHFYRKIAFILIKFVKWTTCSKKLCHPSLAQVE